ncbi:MAG: DUF6057 family protein [Tannerellaceae bacterium]
MKTRLSILLFELSILLYFGLFYDYRFMIEEQTDLFLYTEAYIHSFVETTNGFSALITAFLKQFLQFPFLSWLIPCLILIVCIELIYAIGSKIATLPIAQAISILSGTMLWAYAMWIQSPLLHFVTLLIVLAICYILVSIVRKNKINDELNNSSLSKNIRTGTISLCIVSLFVSSKYIPNYDFNQYLKLDYFAMHQQWDQIKDELSGDISEKDIEILNYYFMAEMNGSPSQLNLFDKGFPTLEALISNRENTYLSCARLSTIYNTIGCWRASQLYATEAMSKLESGQNGRFLKQRAYIHLLFGEIETAKVYLNVLKKTLFYRNWAILWLNRINQDPTLDSVSEISDKRAYIGTKPYQISRSNPFFNVENQLSNGANSTIRNYYLSCALIKKHLPNFGYLLREWYGNHKELPLVFQEANLLYEHKRNIHKQQILNYTYHPDVITLFDEYKSNFASNRFHIGGLPILSIPFKNSYFYYYEKFNN